MKKILALTLAAVMAASTYKVEEVSKDRPDLGRSFFKLFNVYQNREHAAFGFHLWNEVSTFNA